MKIRSTKILADKARKLVEELSIFPSSRRYLVKKLERKVGRICRSSRGIWLQWVERRSRREPVQAETEFE